MCESRVCLYKLINVKQIENKLSSLEVPNHIYRKRENALLATLNYRLFGYQVHGNKTTQK